ncbi:secreted RxLR effector protein 161-like [Lathyrus oleraceus]|uniref:secreted RxLR effector protein 161-like n=1 Tax=Pisum sativum TaxID=3888 RepID=UPI0021CE6B69|nr:secreted RxLR effector protein 161-like [Pisum sativum]
MEIVYSEKGITLHQLKYELELLKRFELMNCKSVITSVEINHKLDFDVEGDDVDVTTFKQLVGSLRYLCNTILDICYAIGMVTRFMNKLKWSFYQVIIRILMYVKGTVKYGVFFPSNVKSESELMFYSDSNWCGDRVNRRSTSEYFLKFLGDHISWRSKKKPVIALSICEAKYIACVLSHVKLCGF